MRRIVECVPNFSEGRRAEVVEALVAALISEAGVALLGREMDAAHNRCVISIAGEPEAVARGVIKAVGKAAQLIDLRQHKGEHPRMGATDVVPFIPISGMSMEEAIELSIRVAQRIAAEHRIPVYLYELSARVPARQDLAFVRKGEFEGIREEIRSNPERKPDFGPSEVHPSAGVIAVGARPALIAYNVYLDTPDVQAAKAIAKAVRYSSGGLPYVKALGFEIKERIQVQVSMNLTNFEGTPIFRAFDAVSSEAARLGVKVVSSEIVGLVPQKALNACSGAYLKLENFSERQILENRLSETVSTGAEPTLAGFLAGVAAPDAVPGGGSVAALAGSLAAALGEMVAGLTCKSSKFAAVHGRVQVLQTKLEEGRRELFRLIEEDASAYQGVVRSMKMPKDTPEEKTRRAQAIRLATRGATETPLRTVRVSAKVLELLGEISAIGNGNARSDAATAAQLAFAAIKGGQYNVLTNLPGLKDTAFADQCRAEIDALIQQAAPRLKEIDALMNSS